MKKKTTKVKKQSVITKIHLDWGHNEQYAVFLDDSLEYDGNRYDAGGAGDFQETVTELLMKLDSKPKIVEINDIKKISKKHKEILLESNSDWESGFDKVS